MVVSGIDCNRIQAFRDVPFCGDYHRWETAVPDSGGGLTASWTDDAGSPDDFHTGIVVDKGRRADAKGPADTNGYEGLPEDLPSAPADDADPNLAPWYVPMTLHNQSSYTLRWRNLWNNEGTHFQDNPPVIWRPNTDSGLQYGNSELVHGPNAVFMYDAYDAKDAYKGTVYFKAQTDCTFIPLCPTWSASADAVPDGAGRLSASHSDTRTFLPLFYPVTVTYANGRATTNDDDGDDG
jgi:hypothetical protein